MRATVSERPGGAHRAHGAGNRFSLRGSSRNPAPILCAAPSPLGSVLRCALAAGAPRGLRPAGDRLHAPLAVIPSTVIRAARDKLFNNQDRVAGILAAETDQAKIHALLTKEIHHILTELSHANTE